MHFEILLKFPFSRKALLAPEVLAAPAAMPATAATMGTVEMGAVPAAETLQARPTATKGNPDVDNTHLCGIAARGLVGSANPGAQGLN